jgi:hypothetical protein
MHRIFRRNREPHAGSLHPEWPMSPPPLAVHPEALRAAAPIAVDAECVLAFLDHYHQHPDHADLVYDVQPPG